MGQANRPQNYDKALDGREPNWKDGMPNPGLNATKDFGSATRDVLKTKSSVMGGASSLMEGVRSPISAHHGDMTGKSVGTGFGKMRGFGGATTSSSQVPNTGPTPTDIGSKVSSRKVMDSSTSKIFHGNPSQKKL